MRTRGRARVGDAGPVRHELDGHRGGAQDDADARSLRLDHRQLRVGRQAQVAYAAGGR